MMTVSYARLDSGDPVSPHSSHIMYKIRKKTMLCVILLLGGLLFLLVQYRFSEREPVLPTFKPNMYSRQYHNWIPFKPAPQKSKEWYEGNCFSSLLIPKIANLAKNLQELQKVTHPECRLLNQIINQIFSIDVRHGSLVVPDDFVKKVMAWLGNDKKLFDEIKAQNVMHVYNMYSGEHTVYNPLRSKRPMSKPSVDPKSYVDTIANSSKSTCDFCKYTQYTAEDTFGRLESTHSVTASNTFKLDSWHALFILKSHHPTDFTEEQLLDLFGLSNKWFDKVHSLNGELKYPQLLWDTMPHAGASQVHPHVHGILSHKRYYGLIEQQRVAGQRYFEDTGRNYFTDLAELHYALGLATSLGNATAISYLNARKDNEVMILSSSAGTDFFRLLYFTIKAFFDELGIYCFSSGMAYPILEDTQSGQMPAIIRIATRGEVSAVRSDISSIELYLMSNVNVDPYAVIEALKKSISKGMTRST